MKARLSFLFFLSCFVLPSVFAFEPYDLIDAVLLKKDQPRVLNSDDLSLQPNDPQPLFTPTGDFNGDGTEDMAIAGIYGFPPGKNKYFLLVGTQYKDPVRFEKFYFREYSEPVFLHKPGTTGEQDPGTQAFAVTFCSQCSDGFDYFWDKKKKTFRQQSWVRKIRRYQSMPHIPETDLVPPESVDKAMQIVGNLNDVKIFVAGMKKAGKQLGTRVRAVGMPNVIPANRVAVAIFEKKKDKEVMYDEITVDLSSGTVVRRGKKP